MTVPRRPLGRSGVEVPLVGFGCGGSARLMVGDDSAEQQRAVSAAFDEGIDYFDTAPAYGNGRSEINLGRALRADGRPAIVLTKVVLSAEQLSDVRGSVLASVEASLGRLQRDRVDVVLLHNRVAYKRSEQQIVGVGPLLGLDDVTGPGGVLEAFGELMSAGTTTACGITAFGGEQPAVDEVLATGVPTVINAAFSVLEPSSGLHVPPPGGDDHGQVIDRAAASGAGVLAIRVLGNGQLLEGVAPKAEHVLPLRELARRLGRGDPYLGCVRFALSKPGVSSLVLGFSEEAHVHAAAQAVRQEPLSEAELQEVAGELRAMADAR